MNVSPSRAAEILAAYGADPARWPEAERADCLALVERLPSLGYNRRLAAALDHGLIRWAREPAVLHAGDADRAVAVAMAALPSPARARSRAWIGGALAASVAAAIALVSLQPRIVGTGPRAPAAVTQAQADSALFRSAFTPTQDEEEVLS